MFTSDSLFILIAGPSGVSSIPPVDMGLSGVPLVHPIDSAPRSEVRPACQLASSECPGDGFERDQRKTLVWSPLPLVVFN